MAPEKGRMIARSDFPMYLVKSLDERHFLVAGGGGQAKTGVANAIEIYEVKKNGDKLQTSSICRYDVGDCAPMNGARFYDGRHHTLAAGLEDECQLFSLKYRVVSPTKQVKKEDKTETVKRKGKNAEDKTPSSDNQETQNQTKYVTFEVEKLASVKTDFCSEGAFQKVVKFNPDNSILATGGLDGHLRIWKTDGLSKLHDIEAHSHEIDDLDFSPKGDKIVSVSWGSCFSVWNTKDGKRHLDMEWPGKSGEHRFRACRFGLIEGKLAKGFNLFTISIPCKRSTNPDPCFIGKWDGTSFKPKLIVNAGKEVLSAMAISDDGTYLGVGMITGSVAVYISFSLQKLYYVKECHGIFVTGIDFMPTSDGAKAVTGSQDFTMLSISADNTVRLHQEPPRAEYNVLLLLLGFVVCVLAIFWVLADMGV